MTPQEEATQIFANVIRDLTSSNHDIKMILRQCQHACQLLSWSDQKDGFGLQLGGWLADAPLPSHRIVQGKLSWKSRSHNLSEIISDVAEQSVYSSALWERDAEVTSIEVRWGIDPLIQMAQTGYLVWTGETKEVVSRSGKGMIEVERAKTFSPASFAAIVAGIERMTYEFASQSYATLRYGNVLSDFWADYRTQVDATLQRLNLSNHLDAIQSGLQSDNPESWRSAVFACRSLLTDVANYLWQDPRPKYEHLPGQKGKLDVSQGNSKNRLSAYLHQKGFLRRRGRFIQDEIERLSASIDSLIEYQSTAHDSVVREDARSIALATYFILGELVIKTDMEPVVSYGQPGQSLEAIDR